MIKYDNTIQIDILPPNEQVREGGLLHLGILMCSEGFERRVGSSFTVRVLT